MFVNLTPPGKKYRLRKLLSLGRLQKLDKMNGFSAAQLFRLKGVGGLLAEPGAARRMRSGRRGWSIDRGTAIDFIAGQNVLWRNEIAKKRK
jgi:hypothetical protein